MEDTPNGFIHNPAVRLFVMGASNHPTTQVAPQSDNDKLERLLSDLQKSDHINGIEDTRRNMAVIVSDGIWVKPDVLSLLDAYDACITNDINGRHRFVIKV